MKAKVHFKSAIEPSLQEGTDIVANCGQVVKNAQFAMKFDSHAGEAEWSEKCTVLLCGVCAGVILAEFVPPQNDANRFYYGLIDGQYVKDHAREGSS